MRLMPSRRKLPALRHSNPESTIPNRKCSLYPLNIVEADGVYSLGPCVFHHPFSRALDEHSMGLFSTRMLILQHQSLLAAVSAPPGSEGRPCLSQPVPTSRRAAPLNNGAPSRRSDPVSICSNPSNSAS